MRLLTQPNLTSFDPICGGRPARSKALGSVYNSKNGIRMKNIRFINKENINRVKRPLSGGCPARSKAIGSGPIFVGIRGFESLPPHFFSKRF